MSEPLILGIESTCDETGVALVRGRELLADVTATSMDEYARFGGIIPEIASRAHLESFLPTLDAALAQADVDLSEVDAVAVCAGPGLIGSLTVGISAAKALAASIDRCRAVISLPLGAGPSRPPSVQDNMSGES